MTTNRSLAALTVLLLTLVSPASAQSINDREKHTLDQFAVAGDMEGAKDLLARHVDVNGKDSPGDCPLTDALEVKCPQMVALLLDNGADANSVNGDPPLGETIYDRDFAATKLLIDHGGNPLGKLPGLTYLQQALSRGSSDIAELLVNAGADVNSAAFVFPKETVLQAALEYSPVSVDMLVAHGAHLNATDAFGRTALVTAVRYGRQNGIRTLLSHGAVVTVKDKQGLTALDYANDGLHPQTLLLLEKLTNQKPTHKLPVERRERYPRGVIVRSKADLFGDACGSNDVEAMQALLGMGVSPGAENSSGYLPLSAAIDGNAADAIDLLLSHHADASQELPDEVLPIDSLANCTSVPVWAAFIRHGVKLDEVAAEVLVSDPESPVGKLLAEHHYKATLPAPDWIDMKLRVRRDDPDLLKRLLDLGMDANDPSIDLNHNLLTLIASGDANVESLQLLLDRGADPTARDQEGKTALDYVNDGHHPIATKLLTDAVSKWNATH